MWWYYYYLDKFSIFYLIWIFFVYYNFIITNSDWILCERFQKAKKRIILRILVIRMLWLTTHWIKYKKVLKIMWIIKSKNRIIEKNKIDILTWLLYVFVFVIYLFLSFQLMIDFKKTKLNNIIIIISLKEISSK